MSKLDKKFWRKYFTVYDVLNELTPYTNLLKTIEKEAHITSADTVLDLGAGTCNFAAQMSIRPYHLEGFDSSPEGLECCAKKVPWVATRVGNIEHSLPYDDASFDVIVSNNTLYTISRAKRDSIVHEMFRVAKPNARIVIANLLEGFSPLAIYLHGIRTDIKRDGIFATTMHIIRVLPSTMRIFYYNSKIRREHAHGSYDFFQPGEQHAILEQAGFVVEKNMSVYANQAELTLARKPL